MMVVLWIKRLFRSDGKPLPGLVWKRRLSIAYAVVSWHLFIGVIYYNSIGRKKSEDEYGFTLEDPEQASEAVKWARQTGSGTAKVYRFSGLQNLGGYTVIGGEIQQSDENIDGYPKNNIQERTN